jgi:Sec-independent protein translocase protein TatA
MNLFRVIIEIFILYLLYKLVFDLLIPAYQATKEVKKKFGQMQADMQEQINRTQQAATNSTQKAPPRNTSNEDYIDFEEVK